MAVNRTPSLEAKLEAIKLLKAEYGIGTQAALNYLRADKEYSKLRDNVAELLEDLGIDYKPSCKEITNASRLIEEVLDSHLTDKARKIEKRYVNFFCSFGNEELDKIYNLDDVVKNLEGILVKYNIEEVLTLFFAVYKQSESKYIALKLTLSFLLKEAYIEENEQLTNLSEFFKRNFGSDFDFYDIEDESVDDIDTDIETIPPHALYFLIRTHDAYETALKEHTLNRIETERRVALNEVLEPHNKNFTIDKILEENKNKINEYLEKIKKTEFDYQKDYWKRGIERLKYKRRAIITNRRWLERFLNS